MPFRDTNLQKNKTKNISQESIKLAFIWMHLNLGEIRCRIRLFYYFSCKVRPEWCKQKQTTLSYWSGWWGKVLIWPFASLTQSQEWGPQAKQLWLHTFTCFLSSLFQIIAFCSVSKQEFYIMYMMYIQLINVHVCWTCITSSVQSRTTPDLQHNIVMLFLIISNPKIPNAERMCLFYRNSVSQQASG